MTFFVLQATRMATMPASNWGLRQDRNSVPLGLVNSGRMIAESTATGHETQAAPEPIRHFDPVQQEDER